MVARVQHPDPAFKGTAVVDGGFEGTSNEYPLLFHLGLGSSYNGWLSLSPSRTWD